MKENFKLGIILAIITSIAGVLLGLANGVTKDAIAENSKLNKEDLALIMPLATSVEETDKELEGNILEILEGKNGSEEVGYLFKVNTKGFHGPVDLMIGISNEGKTTGLKVISHSETPGLGAKIDEDKFKERFKNVPIDKGISMVKTTPTSENEVEGVTGATISSKAVGTAVNEAINYYRVNIQGEAPIDENGTDANSGASES
ncbi:RnfABCDGE type electron transport complex subunit G [Clostridium intestinale]|jgi:electron transport complex protein RnfG|uniref:RnfABCDGE type electron transport complex subunit G n=1 Tax=Clostridium intestinale TaxID=36845 RepID=UPI002DD6B8D2|nr:RnfABCDGE type electron transport complex subunit G [Clostridium intestinale]WRY51437.1 RnfABCDGE type electron transport complex subunit G [Clostridium intestinale]